MDGFVTVKCPICFSLKQRQIVQVDLMVDASAPQTSFTRKLNVFAYFDINLKNYHEIIILSSLLSVKNLKTSEIPGKIILPTTFNLQQELSRYQCANGDLSLHVYRAGRRFRLIHFIFTSTTFSLLEIILCCSILNKMTEKTNSLKLPFSLSFYRLCSQMFKLVAFTPLTESSDAIKYHQSREYFPFFLQLGIFGTLYRLF